MEINVHSQGRPVVRAVVRVECKDGHAVELKTDKHGVAFISAQEEPTGLAISRLGYQRELRPIKPEDVERGLAIELQAANAWYGLQRLLESAAEAIALLPVAEAFTPGVRRVAMLAAWMARQRAPQRHAALWAVFIALWAAHEFPVSPWSTSYHNWIDALALPVPSPFDGRQTLRPHYPSGRKKVLGPGEVVVHETVVIDRGASLTIRPDTTLRFAHSAGLLVHGEIHAEGTADRPIVLEPYSPGGLPVRWTGIYVGAEPTGEYAPERVGTASFVHCRFHQAGGFEYGKFSEKPGPRPKRVTGRGPQRTRGGALFVHNPLACRIEHCLFSRCQAAYGGAIYLRETKDAVIGSSVFEENSAEAPELEDVGGGAVCLWASSPSFLNCAFRQNIARSAKGAGGAVYVAQQSIPTFRGCQFVSNSSGGRGGAIYGNDTLKAQDEHGLSGAIERELIEQCVFERNVSGQGGALAFKDRVSPYILRCTFRNNAAHDGTAVFIAPEYRRDAKIEKLICEGLRFEGNSLRCAATAGAADVSFHLGSGSEERMRRVSFLGGGQPPVKVDVKVYQDVIDDQRFCHLLMSHNDDLRPTEIATRPKALALGPAESTRIVPGQRPW
jgi:predicted outer membrane repeat protein